MSRPLPTASFTAAKPTDAGGATLKDSQVAICASEAALEWGELEAAEEGAPKLPTFKMVAYTGGPMRVGGFYHPVVVDLTGVKAGGKQIPIYRDHDSTKIVGHGSVTVTPTQILAEGIVSFDNEHAREVVTSSKNQFPWQASIGAGGQYEFVRKGEKVTVNGRTISGPVNVFRKSVVGEISFVPRGADGRTSATVAARHNPSGKDSDMDFTAWLEAQGFTQDQFDQLSASAQKLLKDGFAAEQAGDDDPPTTPAKKTTAGSVTAETSFDDIVAQNKRERERRGKITALSQDAMRDFPDQLDRIEAMGRIAIEAGTDPRDFELELLRETRVSGPSNVRRTLQAAGKVIEAAICLSLGIADPEKKFDEKTLEAADREFKYGIGLQQILFRAAAANGQHFDTAHNTRALLKAAFPQEGRIAAGGFSTFDLPGILANTMTKSLVDYFNSVDNAWRQISAIAPVNDFKSISRYSLTGDLQYEQIGPAGEIKHGTLGEESYSNQAKTYAKMIAITREDIINDDLGAFLRVPQRLGRGAALKVNDVFWTTFLNNTGSFFHTNNSNVSTGNDSALSLSDGGGAINEAEIIFMNQTDPDGKPISVMPRIMLVPPTLNNTAIALMGGAPIVTGANTTIAANLYQGRYRVVTSPYMENSSYTGYSAAAWYLLADPRDMPVIETVFLRGREMPVIESADADFDQLGIQVRGYHDFGCALQEPRGGVRSAGS